ncbi:MAG: hypothetical protein O2973_10615 [Gemmatimonadetes bacterium]|nr:hypothetical protein [Gemmatimonadota bacterium]
MTRRLALRTLVVTMAFVAATAISWWALPIAAGLFGALTARDRSGAVVAGFAGMLAWAAALAYDAVIGPVGAVASTLGGVLQIRPIGVYVLTLSFAGLISVCSAIVARSAVRAFASRSASGG